MMLENFKKKLSPIVTNPTVIIVFSFLFVILIGSALLTFPFASESGTSTPYIDCLFTATSATCVTGLITVDTADHWTTFGELVILCLIQIGGLGFITLATFFLSFMRQKAGLRSMMLAQESISSFSLQETVPLVRQIILLVFGIEFAGAFLLSLAFVPQFGLKGIYYGFFHAISAFCNAGFDLMGGFKSMSAYNNNPLVLYTIDALIVVGGLGFIVWKDLIDYRKTKKLMVHTKMVLIITAVLLVSGSLFIYFVEYNQSLKSLNVGEKVNASIFLSVNARTAGYASTNLDAMKSITKVFVSMLMFIGGASGSTAGGIKVNTLGIMIIAIICVIKSSESTVLQRKRIPGNVVMKSFAVTVLAGVLVFTVTMLINLMQPQLSLVNTLFEATSGFGTVGLTTGITPHLHTGSKLLIILSMFAGRVGPISFALAFSLLKKNPSNTVYPEGKFIVG
ncbi:MAG: TrkH family potassium uptake protein [Clostridia bacterium]|nr:TrkH family potassium uptake protein [Clostridia bacterium]